MINKRFFQLLIFFLLQILIVFVHLMVVSFLPPPYNRFNLSLVFLILYLAITIRPQTLWLLLPFIWFTELFSSLPFGVNALALLIVLVVFNLMIITIFSNRSLPTIILLSVFSVFFYRILLWLILKTVHLFAVVDLITIDLEWWQNLGWEIFLTTFFTVAIYFFLSLFLKRLRPEYITALQKEYEPKRYFR